MLNNNYIFSLNIWASRISLFWFESSHWFVDSQKNAKYHKTCASSIWHSRGRTYKPVQARLHLFEMFIWHRKRSIKEPSPVSVALMGFQQTCPENKTSPVLTSCFSNDQRRMSSSALILDEVTASEHLRSLSAQRPHRAAGWNSNHRISDSFRSV